MKKRLSIIIPILNEADTIGKLMQHIFIASSASNISEIIVVDGGSTDGSQEIVLKLQSLKTEPRTHKNKASHKLNHAPISLISSEKGRAKQMNAGAKIAKGNLLYFLHADSFPPKNFDQYIINEVEKGNQAGCFRMQFDSTHWWLKLTGWLTQFGCRVSRGGDQSQFITRQLFDEIGGYDERYVIYEDNILISDLFVRKQFVVINKILKTSARRYRKHGVWKLQYHFLIIYAKKWVGADANELLAYYKKHIY